MSNPKLKFLEDVPWDNSLRLSNGKTVHGLEQLPMVIKFSDEEVFNSHVTADKNDFANWIRDVIGDAELADKLLPIKTKDDFLKFMEQAINDIKNYKEPEPVVQPVSQSISQPVQQPSSQSSVQPIVQSVVQPVVAVKPVVQPIIEPVIQPVIQQSTPVVAPIPMIVTTPVVVPLSPPAAPTVSPITPVVSPIPESVVATTPKVSDPLVAPTLVSAVPVSQPAIAQVASPETTNAIIEEIFDFEEIFKVLIAELDKDVLSWDTQTS